MKIEIVKSGGPELQDTQCSTRQKSITLCSAGASDALCMDSKLMGAQTNVRKKLSRGSNQSISNLLKYILVVNKQ